MSKAWIKRRQLKSGKLRYDVRWRDPATGKEKSVTRTRWKDADALCTEINYKIDHRIYTPPKDILFSEFADKYLESKKNKDGFRPKSYATYAPHVRRLKEYFGDYLLRNIDQEAVELFAGKLNFASNIFTLTTLEKGHKDLSAKLQKKLKAKDLKLLGEQSEAAQDAMIRSHLGIMEKLAPATRRNCLMILSSMFLKGEQWNYVDKNPVRFVDRPKKPKTRMKPWTIEDLAKIVAATEQWHRCTVLTIEMSGVRLSEALGATWPDIDFERKCLVVRRTQQQGVFYNDTKTDASFRDVDLPDYLLEELKMHRAFLALELDENPHNLIFPNRKGNPQDGRNFTRRVLHPAIGRAGVHKITRPAHALRHSYLSAMAQLKAEPKFLQKQAGHSSGDITNDIYTHLYPDSGRAELKQFETGFKEALEQLEQNKDMR